MSTGEAGRKQILFTHVDGDVYRRAADLLHTAEVDLHQTSWDSSLLEVVESIPYDAVVIGYPVAEEELERFLAAARSEEAACRRAGLLLLTNDEHQLDAGRLLGRGANRVVTTEELDEALASTLAELIQSAPRLPLRTAARIKLFADGRPLRVMAQIENISTSGMLLRGVTQFPPGTTFDFEITLPGEPTPVRGKAEITRTTDVRQEGVEGIGVRFLSFVGADRLRLDRYLTSTLP